MNKYYRKIRVHIILSAQTWQLLQLTEKEMIRTGKKTNKSQIIEHAIRKLYSDPLQEKKERQKELGKEITTLSEEIAKLQEERDQTQEQAIWDSKKSSTY